MYWIEFHMNFWDIYGGHIADNKDRKTNNEYLKTLIKSELLTGYNLSKIFKSTEPSKFNYNAYMKYIIEKLTPESPILFYLHPNENVSYLTS